MANTKVAVLVGAVIGLILVVALLTGVLPFARGPEPAKVTIIMVRGSGIDQRLGFSPENLTLVIGVNNTIVWVNQDTTWHTAHSNIPEFDSRIVEAGQTFTHTFRTPGRYPYHCDPHPWMTGIITVKVSQTSPGYIQTIQEMSMVLTNLILTDGLSTRSAR